MVRRPDSLCSPTTGTAREPVSRLSRLSARLSVRERNVGLKPTAKDLALFVSDADAAAAAVFTRNHFPGAPVVRCC